MPGKLRRGVPYDVTSDLAITPERTVWELSLSTTRLVVHLKSNEVKKLRDRLDEWLRWEAQAHEHEHERRRC